MQPSYPHCRAWKPDCLLALMISFASSDHLSILPKPAYRQEPMAKRNHRKTFYLDRAALNALTEDAATSWDYINLEEYIEFVLGLHCTNKPWEVGSLLSLCDVTFRFRDTGQWCCRDLFCFVFLSSQPSRLTCISGDEFTFRCFDKKVKTATGREKKNKHFAAACFYNG